MHRRFRRFIIKVSVDQVVVTIALGTGQQSRGKVSAGAVLGTALRTNVTAVFGDISPYCIKRTRPSKSELLDGSSPNRPTVYTVANNEMLAFASNCVKMIIDPCLAYSPNRRPIQIENQQQK